MNEKNAKPQSYILYMYFLFLMDVPSVWDNNRF